MTTRPGRSPGCFRGYINEQKTLRSKLDQLLKWTRDLKSNIMKQSCKALQTNNTDRQIIEQIHVDLDEYKRKLDRELGRIHDICDALTSTTQTAKDDEENRHDKMLEALRRSPTYSALEQHIYDDNRPRIRVKPRERTHPGQNRTARAPLLTTETIKRKATQPLTMQLLDTSSIPGSKRRPQISSFKRSRSFTNIEHTETQLGMDYIEEDESDLAWKPFGPKRSISQISLPSINNDQSNDEQPTSSSITTAESLPKPSLEKAKAFDDGSSDEEFDVAWQRRAKQKGGKEAEVASSPSKRSVRFASSTHEPVEVIELDLDETTEDGFQQTKDQNNNNKQQNEEVVISIADIDEDETTMPATDTQTKSQITTTSSISLSSQQKNNQDDDSQIIDDSDDDEIIALSDEDIPKRSNISRKKAVWTSSEIEITGGNSQSQSLHNPYRVGITDPSIRSIFLPPPSSQTFSQSSGGNRRTQGGGNRKTSPAKRTTNAK